MNTQTLTIEETILERENAVSVEGGVNIPFPDSDFIEVSNEDAIKYPYKYTGRIAITMSDGTKGHGTGTLIGSRWVLTAAHNVMNSSFGKATSLIFTPGQTRNKSPFGSFKVKRALVLEDYAKLNPPFPGDKVKDFTKYLYDYALLELEQDIFPKNHLQPYPATQKDLNDRLLNTITGYPGHKPDGSMWYAIGQLQKLVKEDEPLLFYKTSTNPGDSGAAITMHVADDRRIVGVHVAGSEELNTNFGVRITDTVYKQILTWMQS